MAHEFDNEHSRLCFCDSISRAPSSGEISTRSFIKELELNHLYSISSFNWSIAGDQENPNVLSELTWQNLQSYGIHMNMGLRLNAVIKPYISFVAEKNYKGVGRDVDYTENDRQGIRYDRAFDSGIGYYTRLAVLHPITNSGNMLVGLSSSSQKLSLFHESIGKNSFYKAVWFGLEGKLSNSFFSRNRFTIQANNSVRLSRYVAEAEWILRKDLKQPVSFKHYAFIGELESAVKLLFELNKDIVIGTGGQLILQKSLPGDDVLFFSNGDVALTQFNGVNGRRFACFLSINIKL